MQCTQRAGHRRSARSSVDGTAPEKSGEDVETRAAAPTKAQQAEKAHQTEGFEMKYMLMMFGDADVMMVERTPEWVQDMMAFMLDFNEELGKTGELVDARGLAFPNTAKTVSLVDGQVVVTDGPFAETKEALAGYWVLDVADEARAIELAGRVVVWAGRVELRETPDAPSEHS
jgi:hypothetical protein